MNEEQKAAIAKMPHGTLIPIEAINVTLPPGTPGYVFMVMEDWQPLGRHDGTVQPTRVSLRRALLTDGWGQERMYWVKQ